MFDELSFTEIFKGKNINLIGGKCLGILSELSHLKMDNSSQIIIYQTESGETKLEVRPENETVWLTQKLMAELFQTSVPNINMHLKNVFEEGELVPEATIKDFLIARIEGNREVTRTLEYTTSMQLFWSATVSNQRWLRVFAKPDRPVFERRIVEMDT